jgi:outer membrane protein assembly factor BamB
MQPNKIRVFLALSVLVTIACISLSPVMATSDSGLADSEYPKYQADNQNSGQSPYVGPQNNSTKWNYTPEDESSSISSAPSIGPDGTIYLPTNCIIDSKYGGNLYALNPDGTKKWNFFINDGTQNNLVGSPAVAADGTIYIVDEFYNSRPYGVIYAINSDGSFKWKYIISDGRYATMSGSPAVGNDGTIYITSQFVSSDDTRWYGNLYALNPDGTLKWNHITTDGVGSYISGSPALGTDGTIYFASKYNTIGDMSNVYALNPDGTVKWNYILPDGPNRNYIQGSPAIGPDGSIYVVSFDNISPQRLVNLFALNPDGTFKWKYTINDGSYSDTSASPSVAKDGTIYVGMHFQNGVITYGNLYAINPDGTKKWNFTTPHSIYKEVVIGADGTIYFGASTYYNGHSFNALTPDGGIKWSLEVEPISAAAMGSDGTLYFGITFGGTSMLYAIMGPGSNPHNENNTLVNAATPITSGKTIGMQKTGMPITGIVLTILMALGGFISTRKEK